MIKKNRKWINACVAVLVLICACIGGSSIYDYAAVAKEPVSVCPADKAAASTPASIQAPDVPDMLPELFKDWEESGYPEYVGWMVRNDFTWMDYTVFLKENTEEIQNGIQDRLPENIQIKFLSCRFSHTELLEVKNQIEQNPAEYPGIISCKLDIPSALIPGILLPGYIDETKISEPRIIAGISREYYETTGTKLIGRFGDTVNLLMDGLMDSEGVGAVSVTQADIQEGKDTTGDGKEEASVSGKNFPADGNRLSGFENNETAADASTTANGSRLKTEVSKSRNYVLNNLSVTANDTRLTLSWKREKKVSKYKIKLARNNRKTSSKIIRVKGSVRRCMILRKKTDKGKYSIWVKKYYKDKRKWGDWSRKIVIHIRS